MRIEFRISKFCGDALLEPLRNEMFKALSFLVNLFDGVVQHFEEKCFEEAMMTYHLKSPPFTCRREENSAMSFVLHKWH